jgi:predicted nucleic acid-binding protein
MALAGTAEIEIALAVYLLDTNILSELRRPRPNPRLVAWLSNRRPDDVFISAVSVGELQAGVENIKEQDQLKAAAIEIWVNTVAANYNILAADVAVFREWAPLMHRQPLQLVADAVIAATAIVHNLTMVTRNQKDFERLGLSPLNPFLPAG